MRRQRLIETLSRGRNFAARTARSAGETCSGSDISTGRMNDRKSSAQQQPAQLAPGRPPDHVDPSLRERHAGSPLLARQAGHERRLPFVGLADRSDRDCRQVVHSKRIEETDATANRFRRKPTRFEHGAHGQLVRA